MAGTLRLGRSAAVIIWAAYEHSVRLWFKCRLPRDVVPTNSFPDPLAAFMGIKA